MRNAVITFFVASALSTAASAQPEQPQPTTAELQARSEEMIAASDAAGIFVSEEHPPAIALRHTRSGMLCRFGYDGADQSIAVVPTADVARGEDVACIRRTRMATTTLYATRYPQPLSMDEALAGAVGALRTVHREAREIDMRTLEFVTLGDRPPPPESRSAAFLVTINGEQAFTRVSVYARDGWIYKMRFTSPTQRAHFMADMIWTMTLTELPPPNAGPTQ